MEDSNICYKQIVLQREEEIKIKFQNFTLPKNNKKFIFSKEEELIYDESFFFSDSHAYLKKYEEETKRNSEGYPFLMNHEYILGGSLSYDSDKNLSDMNNKELLIIVKSRVQSFLNNGDATFK